jgi:uncharacterized protein
MPYRTSNTTVRGERVETRESTSTPPALERQAFAPAAILATIVILTTAAIYVPLGAALVVLWVWHSGTPWREIGYERPTSWTASVLAGVGLGFAFKLLMKTIIMPLLGAPPINAAFHHLVGNRAAIPGFLLPIVVFAGFGEETIYRGYLFERLRKLLGNGISGKTAAVLISSVLFGLAHYQAQGLSGTEQATIVGLVFGTIFARTGTIWMLMVAHVAFDLTAYGIIYWNLELKVAHLVFKQPL